MRATANACTPQAMPVTRAKKTKLMSQELRRRVRKRTMARAPTREKARAMLLPMTIITMAATIAKRTREYTMAGDNTRPGTENR